MRKFLTALIAVAFGVVMAIPALAAGTNRVAPHLVVRQYKWRTHTTSSTTLGFHLDEAGIGCVDSLAFNTQVNGSKLGSTDTSEAISLEGLPVPAELTGVPGVATLAVDSMIVAGKFIIADAGATGAVDTTYFGVQVSVDRKNWINLNSAASATDPTNGTGYDAITGQLLPTSGATFKTFAYPLKWGCTNDNAWSPGGVTRANTRFWPYCRLIVQNDGSSATVIKNFNLYFVTYSTGEELNGNP